MLRGFLGREHLYLRIGASAKQPIPNLRNQMSNGQIKYLKFDLSF